MASNTRRRRSPTDALRDPLAVSAGPLAHVAVGPDQVNADLVVEAAVALIGDTETISCAADRGEALASALATPGLFGPRQVFCADLGACSVEYLGAAVEALRAGGAALVARADKLDAKARTVLGAAGELIALYDCSTPDVRRRGALLDRLAQHNGVTLSPDARQWLGATLGDDLARARSVLAACGAAGITEPTLRHLAVLAGTRAGGSGRGPFALSDAIEAGDVAGALGWLDESRADPFATLGYLRARFASRRVAVPALFAAEAGLRSAAEPAAVMDQLVVRLCSTLGRGRARR
jgi:DNA polymerase III delta subunit